jgi:hypothetical protein
MIAQCSLLRRAWLVRALAVSASLVAALAVACTGGGGEPAATGSPTASDDGAVTLTIPAGALPPGVDASDIRVTTVLIAEPQPLEAPDPEADEQPSRVVAVFELEPDGLRFLRPVTLTFRLPRDIVTGPLVALHTSEQGVVPLAITLTDRPESGQIEITTAVEHFSNLLFIVALIDADIIAVKLTAPETVMVKETFTASVDFERLDGTRTVDVLMRVRTFDVDDSYSKFNMPYVVTVERVSWRLGGSFRAFNAINPDTVSDKPKNYLRVTGDTHDEKAVFTCEKASGWRIEYLGTAFVEFEAMPVSAPTGVELPRFEPFSYPVGLTPVVSGRCVAPADTEETQTGQDAEECTAGSGCDPKGDNKDTTESDSPPGDDASQDGSDVIFCGSGQGSYIFTITLAGNGQALAESADTSWYNPRFIVETADGNFTVDGKWVRGGDFGAIVWGSRFFDRIDEAVVAAEWLSPDTLEVIVSNVGIEAAVDSVRLELSVRLREPDGTAGASYFDVATCAAQ